jgi:sugar phosphate isomerase/epimerase
MSKFILSAFGDEISPNLETQMDVLEQFDIRHIEIRNVDGSPIVSYSPDEVKEIKKKLDKRNFKISAVGSPIGKIKITDDFEPHFELFKHTVEIAKILETGFIRMFSFYIPEGENPEDFKDEVFRRWESFAGEVRDSGIILAHENEKGIYGDTAERCLELVNHINQPYVRSVFDPANFIQCNVKPYPDAYNLLKDTICYLHIKDAVASDGHVVPAGEGDGKIAEILSDLHNRGFEGFLSIEPHLGYFKGLEKLEHEPSIVKLPEGGPRNFALAANALRDLAG